MRWSPLAALSAALATAAYSQTFDFQPSPLATILPSITRNDPIGVVLREREARQRGEVPDLRPQVSPQLLRYRISAVRRQANYARFVAYLRRADPAGAEALAASLRSDPLTKVAPDLARMGLRIDDVADAYAAYWTEAWDAANQRDIKTAPPGQQRAVQQQAAAYLLSAPEFATTSEATKQELAESLWLQALGLNAARQEAQGDPAKLAAIARAVRVGAKKFNLDLDSMTLTDDGFVQSGK